jgi:hypothetical protein
LIYAIDAGEGRAIAEMLVFKSLGIGQDRSYACVGSREDLTPLRHGLGFESAGERPTELVRPGVIMLVWEGSRIETEQLDREGKELGLDTSHGHAAAVSTDVGVVIRLRAVEQVRPPLIGPLICTAHGPHQLR